MGFGKTLTLGVLAAAVTLSSAEAPAGGIPFRGQVPVEPFVVRGFDIGPVGLGFIHRFFSAGGEGATDVRRDDYLRLVFSDSVDLNSIGPRTVRILKEDGTSAVSIDDFPPAWGPFYYSYVEYRFDPVGGAFVPDREYRRRVLIDPTLSLSPPEGGNPTGFDPDTTFLVTIPGRDEGATETVRSRDGRPLARTFRTTFRTGSKYNTFYYEGPDYTDGAPPSVESIEASDAPGVPLEGRTDVHPRSAIVVRFSAPVLRSSFEPRPRFRVPDWLSGKPFRFRGRLSEDGQTLTLRPRRRLPRGVSLLFYYPSELVGRSGIGVGNLGPFNFQAATRR